MQSENQYKTSTTRKEKDRMKTTIGTSHFVSFTKACDYYRDYEPDATPAELERHVRNKIDEGDISIGHPEIKPGETLSIIDEGTRYAITTTV